MPKIRNKTRTFKALRTENRLLKEQVKELEKHIDEDHVELTAWSDRFYEEHAQVSVMGGKLQDALMKLRDLERKNQTLEAVVERRDR
jgi:hypothetical protein